MNSKITLLLLLLSLAYCYAIDTICVKSSDESVKSSQTGATWEIECSETCVSINNCNFSSQLSTKIVLESGYHNVMLSSILEFEGRDKITIQGSILGTRISCAPSTGLVFINNNEVSILNVVIENCGAHHSTYHGNFSSAVFISEITNVQLFNVTISNSFGSAISLINIRGKATVDNCKFWGNIRSLTSSVIFVYYCVACKSSVVKDTEVLITNSSITSNSQNNTFDHIIMGLSVTFDGCASHVSTVISELVFSGGLGKGILVHFKNSSTQNSLIVSSSSFSDIAHNIGDSNSKHCHDLTEDHNILQHAGGGISVLFDGSSSQNTVVINGSHFTNNTAFAGEGSFIAFLNSSHHNRVEVIASTFSRNVQGDFTCGGGQAIYLMNASNHNSVIVDRCNFISNTAMRGAGMYIQFQDSTSVNTLSVKKCTFFGNKSPDLVGRKIDSGGGGIEAGYYFRETHAPTNNTVSIISCDFEQNYANFGGGTLLFSSYAFHKNINNSFTLIDCLWKNNSANFGAAIDLTSKLTVHNHPPQGILPIPVFSNCTFVRNKVIINETGNYNILGKGTFISTDMSAHFKGTTIFDKCNGSAIHMTSGFLIFDEQSDVTFSNNNGSLGGAIDLVGRSSILICDHSRFYFINNSAILNGGAISYFTTDRHSFASFRNCFIEYIGSTSEVSKRDIEFLFIGNTATVGNSIHASTVKHCHRHLNNCTTDPFELFSCIANFTFPKDDVNLASYQLATSGVKFNVNQSLLPLQVIPGKTIIIPITMVDEFNHLVPSLYQLKLGGNSSSFIPRNYATLFNTTRTRIYGNPGDHVELIVFNKAGLHETELKFNVSIQNCPPGYVIMKKSEEEPYNTCYCTYGLYVGTSCNYSAFHARLARGYWIGYDKGNIISENSLISGYCPEGFCNQNSNTRYILPSNASKSEVDQKVCAIGRTGILCGKCRDNYSVYYHGWILKCLENTKCSYGPVLYIILELLPITIVFILIILFDVPFTSGAANGFVLFCQVIDTLQVQANRFIWMPAPVYILNTVSLRFVYKILSLQFFTANDIDGLKFLSFCLWKGSTGLDMLAFHYVTLLYSLLLVIVTVKVMDTCNIRKYCCECCFKMRRKRTVRGSITHGLTAFLLLCYSRFAQVSLMILIPGTLHRKHGILARQVVFYDGEIDFLSKTHLFYAVPALIVSVVLFLLPLLLILYPASYKIFSALGIDESKLLGIFCKVMSIENLKPILDSFQSCFKDRFRFFAGLYFFYRLFAVISFAYTSNLSVFYMIVEVQLVLMLMVHACFQPYKKWWHNAIDAMLFADLALINALTTFNFGGSYSKNNNRNIGIVTSVQALLICLPGVYMLFYVIGYILFELCGLKLKKPKCCIDVKSLLNQAILPKCRKYLNKRNATDDSAVELQSFYHSYED